MLDISIIIVSWNVRELLKRALKAIYADANAAQCSIEIIVVDNASRDGTAEMVRADFPKVRVIVNHENVGFTRANNQGLEIAGDARYLFLLNPDTELLPGALRALLDFMDAPANARVGLVGPQLLNSDGSVQPSRRSFPTVRVAMAEALRAHTWYPDKKILRHFYLQDTRDDVVQDVDWIVGAAMFARRAVVEQLGGLDERFFMYSEEVDWCKRIRAAGWRVIYLPNARIVHHEAKSSEQVRAQRDIYFYASKVRYFKKHHGKLQGEFLRLFFLGWFAFQFFEEGAKYLLGHKRGLRADRINAYKKVLANGLR